MTIIDELLILLDDLEEAKAEELPTYFEKPNRQVIFSSLGRLVSRGWIIKRTRRSATYYSISSAGIGELNKTLDSIKKEEQPIWDGAWHLVIFDIPESKRKLRDSFRLILKDECYGILTSSVWVSPWNRDDIFQRFIKRHNLVDNIFLITSNPQGASAQSRMLAHRCWKWAMLEKKYRLFLSTAEKELAQLITDEHNRRFRAKKLVFEYAEIVRSDPQLPKEIAPNVSLARRGYELYVKIRPYCLDTLPT